MQLLSTETIETISLFIQQVTAHDSIYTKIISTSNSTRADFARYLSFRKCWKLCKLYSNLYLNSQTEQKCLSRLMHHFIDIEFKLITLIWLLNILMNDVFFTEIPQLPCPNETPPILLQKAFAGIKENVASHWSDTVYFELARQFLGQVPQGNDYIDFVGVAKNFASTLQPHAQLKNPIEKDLLSGKYGFTTEHIKKSSLECSISFLAELERAHQLTTRLNRITFPADILQNNDSDWRYLMFVLLIYANNIDLKIKTPNQTFSAKKPRQNMMRNILIGFHQYLIASNKTIDLLFPDMLLRTLRESDIEILGKNQPMLTASSTIL